MTHILLLGGGHASAAMISQLRQAQLPISISLVSDEAYLPYQRPPLSKAYLKGDMPEARLALLPPSAYEQMPIKTYLGQKAQKIDRKAQRLILADGTQIPYDHLVIATGGRARALDSASLGLIASPPTETEAKAFYSIRTLDDVKGLKPAFDAARHIAVIGGGYIGLEAASLARSAGKKITLLEAAPRLLARVAAPEVSTHIARLHTQKGVDIVYNAQLETVSKQTHGFAFSGRNFKNFEADFALVGIGLLPNKEIAIEAGLACDQFGIKVNAHCTSDDPYIHAIGDVASFFHPRYGRQMRLESVQNASDQAKILTQHLAGRSVDNFGLPWFWSDQYDLRLQTVGLGEGADMCIARGDAASDSRAFFYLKGGKLIAADCMARTSEFMHAKKLIQAGISLEPELLMDDTKPFKEIAARWL